MVPRNFNPRTPVGCDARFQAPELPGRYFNPRTPVGCDLLVFRRAFRQAISIHAPQWGATTIWTVPNMRLDISIHAPQWGATCHVGAVLGPHIHFNPRTPVGCDRAGQRQAGRWHPISIHAPQWGATQSQEARGADRFHFNPRTPVGCDDSRVVARQGRGLFQSTHPSGVRQHDAPRKHRCGISIHAPQWGATEPSADPPRRGEYFNPRTPVGCD